MSKDSSDIVIKETLMDTAQIFSHTGSEIPVHEIISRLKFLSKLRPGEKINVKYLFIRDNNSIWQRLLRTIINTISDGESKNETLEFVKNVINSAFDLIYVYRKTPDNFRSDITNLIIKNLKESKTGLESLIQTYDNDRLFVSRIETFLQTLDTRLTSLEKEEYRSE